MQKLKQMEQELAVLTKESLLRQLQVMEPVNPARVRIKNREYLLMASNNYLGLTHHPFVKAAAASAAEQYGTGSGGARLTSGNHSDYSALETELAQLKQTEAALVFNTGYMANVGTISALADKNDVIFSDALNHASIIDGCRLSKARTVVFHHSDMAHLDKLLKNTPCSGQRLIVTDGVFSMDGDIARLDEIVKLGEKYDSLIMVDDAHATGVIGPGGRGTAAYYGVSDKVQIEIGTLSKSLAAEGGFVAGSHLLIRYLINRARSFIFSTALSAATIAAARAALQIVMTEPSRVEMLKTKATMLKKELIAAGLPLLASDTPIIPLLISDAAQTLVFSKNLYDAGLIVSAIRPPTVPAGSSRLRLTVTAAHSSEDLAKASDIITNAAKRSRLI
jgi:8-amino-7-oxononanoate synthase